MKLVSLRLPEELIDNLKAKAQAEDRTFNKYVTRVLMQDDVGINSFTIGHQIIGSDETSYKKGNMYSDEVRMQYVNNLKERQRMQLAHLTDQLENVCSHWYPKGACTVPGCEHYEGAEEGMLSLSTLNEVAKELKGIPETPEQILIPEDVYAAQKAKEREELRVTEKAINYAPQEELAVINLGDSYINKINQKDLMKRKQSNLCEHYQPKGHCLIVGCKYAKGAKK